MKKKTILNDTQNIDDFFKCLDTYKIKVDDQFHAEEIQDFKLNFQVKLTKMNYLYI